MPTTLRNVYNDLKRFRNPKTGGKMSEKGRDPNHYPTIDISNILVRNELGIGGGTITWTGLAPVLTAKKRNGRIREGKYAVALKFLYPKDNPIILSESLSLRDGYIRLAEQFNGKNIFVPKVAFSSTSTQMRCGCSDFRFRFMPWLQKQGSLIGGANVYRSKGMRPPVNPKETMGLCKHLNSMVALLRERNVL